jgi:chromosome segregation ATPase
MSNVHDLALSFDAMATTVKNERAKLLARNLQPGYPDYAAWQKQIAALDTQYDHLQDAAVKLDTAYAAERLKGLEAKLQSITDATNETNKTIAEMADINKVLHLIAAAVAAAAAAVAAVANPIVGAPTLLASGEALIAAVRAFSGD